MFYSEFLFKIINSFAGQSELGDKIIVFGAEILPFFVVLGGILFFLFQVLRRGNFEPSQFFTVFFSALLAFGLASLLKRIISAPRPFQGMKVNLLLDFPPQNSAFPSGHVSFLAGASWAVFYFFKKWGLFFLFLTLAVGFFRVAVGIHWVGDIIGGVLLGLFSFWVVLKVRDWWTS